MAYDAIVIGAGIEGSSTAYNLLKKGLKNVLLLEQFSALHNRGSSHGQSRITRKAYSKPYYVEMMKDAYTLWDDLEKESGTTLYRCTGLLAFGPSDKVSVIAKSLASGEVPHEVLSAQEANTRYPQLQIPDTYICVYEEGGGTLNAQKAVMAFQQQFQRLGGTLQDNCQVVQIIPGAEVTVVTSKGTFTAKDLVIAAGSWAPALCSSIGLQLPFKITRTENNYWKVEDADLYSSDKFPVFIGYSSADEEIHCYGLPIEEYPGLLKVCGYEGATITDPDSRDTIGGPTSVSDVATFISHTLKGVATQPSITEYCIFTMSPDMNPVIDRHPLHSNIFIAAGFSGHGFKLSPIVGKLMAELVTRQKPSHDLHPFRADRFEVQKPAV